MKRKLNKVIVKSYFNEDVSINIIQKLNPA